MNDAKMKISLIAAMAENRVIGKQGDLPWHLPEDLKLFKRITRGHYIIMGRKTFESFGGKPLSHRTNIVLSRKKDFDPGQAQVVDTLDHALKLANDNGEKEAFIIGGETLYKKAISFADKLYITLVHAKPKGDTFFPEFNPDLWILNKEEYHPKDNRHQYSFTFQEYIRNESARKL